MTIEQSDVGPVSCGGDGELRWWNAAIKALVYAGPKSILKGRANPHLKPVLSLSSVIET